MFQIIKDYFYIFFGGAYFYLVYFSYGEEVILETGARFLLSAPILGFISAVILFFTLLGVFSIIERIGKKITKKVTQKTESDIDDLVSDLIFSAIHTIKYLGAFYFSTQYLSLSPSIQNWITEFSSVGLLIIALIFTTKFINLIFNHKFIDESKIKSVSKALMPFVRKVIIALVWIVGIITIISNLGYDVTALIAGAGVGGLAVALAAQKSVSNIFGAITILMNKPFTIGDYVTINGHTGTVKDIGLSYITLIDRMGHNVMIPNENIISSSIENETRRKYRRADFAIGLIYDTTLVKMQKGVKIIEEILEPYVQEKKLQKYRVNFDTFGDFSLNINITYFTNTINYDEFVKEKESINLEIKKRFAKAQLEMAFPTQEMIIKGGDIK